MAQITENQLVALVRRLGVVRPLEMEKRGIPRWRLYRLASAGLIERQGRGLYSATDHPYSADHTLVHVAKRIPAAVICLLTALRFHDLTTQLPADVWIALPVKSRQPSLDYPRLSVTRLSGKSFTEGIETHRIEGVDVRVYSAAKTVADCFRFRNKVGIDVAVEALRDFNDKHRGRTQELVRFARINRVGRVMQPYLEAIA